MKRTLLLFLAFVAMWQSAFAYDFSAVAPSGQTLYYNIVNGEAHVTYQITATPRYTDLVGALTIPDSVIYAGTTYAVTSIGKSAFCYCSGLTTVNFNADSCSVGYLEPFFGCSNITTFTFGNNVKIIPSHLCCGLSGLTSVTIPNSVTSIGEDAFDGCSGLTTVNFNADSCTSAGRHHEWAFYGCLNITTFTFGNNVKIIPSYLCYGMYSLTSVTIPKSVTSIGNSAFCSCIGLTSIIVDSENSVYDSRNDCNALIETATNTLLAGCRNTAIPNSVTSIGGSAFADCSDLTSVTIPNSVTTIGDQAFNNCSGLTSVAIPNSVTSIGNGAFYYCNGLTSVTIGNSVTSIGNSAFAHCSGLTSVTISNSVITIGNNAFYYCNGLTSVTIGNSVTNIGSKAFHTCENIRNITCKAVYPPNVGTDVFYRVPAYCVLSVPCGSLPYYQVTEPWMTQFPLMEEDCRAEYAVTAVSADETMGYVVGGGTAMDGDEIIIRAIANPGYRFLRWQDGNTDSVRTVTVTGNATYTAYFSETVGIEEVSVGDELQVWVSDGCIHVRTHGREAEGFEVYDVMGRLVAAVAAGRDACVPVPAGVYLVRVAGLPARKVVVMR